MLGKNSALIELVPHPNPNPNPNPSQDAVKSSPASQHDNLDESIEPGTSGPSQGIMDHTKENVPTYEDSKNQ